MVYQDHLTKFCVLRAMSSKRAAEVAFNLVDIFLLIGAPHILQSDNRSEFTASVITELKLLWPDLLIVHGKPHHPQSQGSVERLNLDIKDMLICWLNDNNTTDWGVGLKFVQYMKNTSYHSGIKQSPYSALFGGIRCVSLRSVALPTEVLERLVSEDDLFAAFGVNSNNTTTDTEHMDDLGTSLSAALLDSTPDPSTSSTAVGTPDPSTSSTAVGTPDPSTSSTAVGTPDPSTSSTAVATP